MNTKGAFSAKFISITKSGANLQFYIFMHEAWNTEERLGEENSTGMQKESVFSCKRSVTIT